jgi:hypothetical protein
MNHPSSFNSIIEVGAWIGQNCRGCARRSCLTFNAVWLALATGDLRQADGVKEYTDGIERICSQRRRKRRRVSVRAQMPLGGLESMVPDRLKKTTYRVS